MKNPIFDVRNPNHNFANLDEEPSQSIKDTDIECETSKEALKNGVRISSRGSDQGQHPIHDGTIPIKLILLFFFPLKANASSSR